MLKLRDFDRHFEEHGPELLRKPMTEWASLISGYVTSASIQDALSVQQHLAAIEKASGFRLPRQNK